MKKFTVLFAFLICASFIFAQSARKFSEQPTKVAIEREKAFLPQDFEIKTNKNVSTKSVTAKNDVFTVVWPIDGNPYDFEGERSWDFNKTQGGTDWVVSDWAGSGLSTRTSTNTSGNTYLTSADFNDGKAAWMNILTATREIKEASIIIDQSISLVGVNNPKVVYRQNFSRINDVNVYVDWSDDGGTTWNAMEVNLDDRGEDSFSGEAEALLIGAGDKNDVKIRFRWLSTPATEGASATAPIGYHWLIDDIKIVDAEGMDLVLYDQRVSFFNATDYHTQKTTSGEPLYHTSSHFGQIPIDQAKSESEWNIINFHGVIKNNGSETVKPSMNVKVKGPDGTIVYDKTVTAATDYTSGQKKDTLDLWVWTEPESTEFLLTKESKLGKYEVTFTALVDGKTDVIPDDNTAVATFELVDKNYSRSLSQWESNYVFGPQLYSGLGEDGVEAGIYYQFNYPAEISGIEILFHHWTSAGISTSGAEINATIWDYRDPDPSKNQAIASIPIPIPEPESGRATKSQVDFELPVTIPIDESRGMTTVLLTLEYTFDSKDIFIVADASNMYSGWGTVFREKGGASYGSILNYRYGPCVALITKTGTSDNPVIPNDVKISVYPNPTSGNLTVENANGGTIEVLNLMGQVVESVSNATDNHNIDLSGYSNGNYFVRVIVDGKVSVEKINLVK